MKLVTTIIVSTLLLITTACAQNPPPAPAPLPPPPIATPTPPPPLAYQPEPPAPAHHYKHHCPTGSHWALVHATTTTKTETGEILKQTNTTKGHCIPNAK